MRPLHIEVVGRGPDLVLLHGWAMHGGIFAPLVQRLTRQFTLHLVDLPGHGGSRGDPGALRGRDCARRIVAQVPSAIWLGWSLGGLVALQAVEQAPDAVRGLIMLATSPRFVATEGWPHGVALEVFRQFSSDLRDDYRGMLQRFLALEAYGSRHHRAELRFLREHLLARGAPDADALAEGLSMLAESDHRGQLIDLGVPSLWIAGGRDRLVAAGALQWVAEHVPQARCLMVAEAGHAPFLGEPDRVAEAIREFGGVAA